MKWLVLYTVVEFGIPWYLMASAEQHVTSSLASLIICATPLISISVTKLLHPQRTIGRQRLIGLALGSIGVLTLVGLDISTDSAWWIGAMFLVAVGYAGGPQIISTKLTQTSGLAVVAVSVAIVATLYTPLGLARWPEHVSGGTWLSLAALALLCTIGAFLLFFALIKEVGPARSTVVTYLNTAIAVALGVIFLHEPLTAGMMIGFPIIVAGSVFATSASKPISEVSHPTA
jgi:drug/metabolite transporter (DMT)-like permease